MLTIIFMILTIGFCNKENQLLDGKKSETSLSIDDQDKSTGLTNKLLMDEVGAQKSQTNLQEDSHYKSIVKSFSVTGEERQCDQELLTTFGVSGEKLAKEQKSSFNEKLYCSNNKNTCCSSENIKSTNYFFAKAATALRKKFEVIEELLSLFRGPMFQEKAFEYKNFKTCSHWVSDISVTINDEKFGFFDYPTQKYMRDTFESLLLRTELYVKKNLWFYGDLICLICSPNHQEHFKLQSENSSVYMHTNTCSEMMNERDYELRLFTVYHSYIYKIMEYIECLNNNEEALAKQEEMTEAEINKQKEDKSGSELFKPLVHEQIEQFETDFFDCWDDEDVKQEKCASLCTKNLRTYQFPFSNLLHNYHASLEVMYKFMTGNDIEEYYKEIKEQDWNLDSVETPITFYSVNENWVHYAMDDIKWIFTSQSGHDVYKEVMSKRYLEFETEKIIKTFGLFVLFAIFSFKI